jgi:hypothetical protein
MLIKTHSLLIVVTPRAGQSYHSKFELTLDLRLSCHGIWVTVWHQLVVTAALLGLNAMPCPCRIAVGIENFHGVFFLLVFVVLEARAAAECVLFFGLRLALRRLAHRGLAEAISCEVLLRLAPGEKGGFGVAQQGGGLVGSKEKELDHALSRSSNAQAHSPKNDIKSTHIKGQRC